MIILLQGTFIYLYFICTDRAKVSWISWTVLHWIDAGMILGMFHDVLRSFTSFASMTLVLHLFLKFTWKNLLSVCTKYLVCGQFMCTFFKCVLMDSYLAIMCLITFLFIWELSVRCSDSITLWLIHHICLTILC